MSLHGGDACLPSPGSQRPLLPAPRSWGHSRPAPAHMGTGRVSFPSPSSRPRDPAVSHCQSRPAGSGGRRCAWRPGRAVPGAAPVPRSAGTAGARVGAAASPLPYRSAASAGGPARHVGSAGPSWEAGQGRGRAAPAPACGAGLGLDSRPVGRLTPSPPHAWSKASPETPRLFPVTCQLLIFRAISLARVDARREGLPPAPGSTSASARAARPAAPFSAQEAAALGAAWKALGPVCCTDGRQEWAAGAEAPRRRAGNPGPRARRSAARGEAPRVRVGRTKPAGQGLQPRRVAVSVTQEEI